MEIKTTTTVQISTVVGGDLVTVARTEEFHIGDNPRFVLTESIPSVVANAETVMVNAARALDRAKSGLSA